MLSLMVNGRPIQVDADPDTPLLWVLRDHVGLTGTKFGCGRALCGACTVHVDGQPVRSCVTPVEAVANAQVTTIEGLSDRVAKPSRPPGRRSTSSSAATASPARS
jgi:isoquinoline 1-oxidoreductase alpha subunit